jgi:hypothetical protein
MFMLLLCAKELTSFLHVEGACPAMDRQHSQACSTAVLLFPVCLAVLWSGCLKAVLSVHVLADNCGTAAVLQVSWDVSRAADEVV